jgi:hypothetical protein
MVDAEENKESSSRDHQGQAENIIWIVQASMNSHIS